MGLRPVICPRGWSEILLNSEIGNIPPGAELNFWLEAFLRLFFILNKGRIIPGLTSNGPGGPFCGFQYFVLFCFCCFVLFCVVFLFVLFFLLCVCGVCVCARECVYVMERILPAIRSATNFLEIVRISWLIGGDKYIERVRSFPSLHTV